MTSSSHLLRSCVDLAIRRRTTPRVLLHYITLIYDQDSTPSLIIKCHLRNFCSLSTCHIILILWTSILLRSMELLCPECLLCHMECLFFCHWLWYSGLMPRIIGELLTVWIANLLTHVINNYLLPPVEAETQVPGAVTWHWCFCPIVADFMIKMCSSLARLVFSQNVLLTILISLLPWTITWCKQCSYKKRPHQQTKPFILLESILGGWCWN